MAGRPPKSGIANQAEGAEPPALSGDGLGGGGFGLKGENPVPVKGGLRNPMAGGLGILGAQPLQAAKPQAVAAGAGSPQQPGAAPAAKAAAASAGPGQQNGGASGKPQTPAAKPGAKGKAVLREVSRIGALDDKGDTAQATHLSQAFSHRGSSNAGRYIRNAVLIMAALAAAGALAWPDSRRRIISLVTGTHEKVIDSVRYRKKDRASKPPRIAPGTNKKPEKSAPVTARRAPVNRTCQEMANRISGRGGVVAIGARLELAECYLITDDLVAAEEALRPLQQRFSSVTEAQLNASPYARNIADAWHTMIILQMRTGKAREAGQMVGTRCGRWALNNTCVGKAMLFGERRMSPPASPEFARMFGTQGGLEKKSQARLWLAGAQMALAERKLQVADQRLKLALAAVPQNALPLKNQIYETAAMYHFQEGEVLKLKGMVNTALKDLHTVDDRAKLKLKLLLEIATSSAKSRTIRSILSREEVTYRVRGDLSMMEILGPEAIRWGAETEYLALIRKTRDHFESRYKATSLVVKPLMVWEIRTLLARKLFEDAMEKLGQYKHRFGDDVFSHHMRGVTYLQISDNAEYHRLATESFQAALRLRSNWESLYGLGTALLNSGRKEQVAAVIKDMEKQVSTRGQKFWLEMLKADWYIATDKYLNAQKILQDWLKDDPDRITPRKLLLKVMRKLGKTAEVDRLETEIDKALSQSRYESTTEGVASPLGPLAVAPRPVD